ncbi:MAG: response regulator [Fretibacterium sp.]|nr:response regulator [Fretibacterium sp.]
MKDKRKISVPNLWNMVVSVLVVLFFLGVIIVYHTMLSSETRQKIIDRGKFIAFSAAQEVQSYLNIGINLTTLTCSTLDNMISEGKTSSDILDYLKNQSISAEKLAMGNSTGIYGLINGEYLDGKEWVPDSGFNPRERPWYIEAQIKRRQVAIVGPYLDAQTNTIMISFSKALSDHENVIAMDYSLNYLQFITERLTNRSETGVQIILDSQYQVIAHSDSSEVGKNYMSEQGTIGKALIDALSSSGDEIVSFRFGGANYVIYRLHLANDWLCLSVFEITSVLNQLRNMLIFTIVMSVLVVSVLSLILLYSNRKARLAREFNEKASLAAAASEAKSSFLSNMSHEIRTPINAVLGMNEMIQRESSEENVLEYSENIRTAGSTLLGLINDILDFSKIEAGKMEIIPVDYDLSSVINDLVNMIQTRADNKGLLLKLDFDENTPKMLNGDEVRIKQVVTNILTNAVKYTKEGSVTFRIAHERIPDDTESVFLDFSVSDTGIGIKPEDIKKLFSEFERIEEERNRNIEGTGLGMNITKRLLEMMGTSLKVESVYGQGSTFSFRLRQKVVKWEALGDYEVAYRASLSARKKYRAKFTAPEARVLVVDDTPMNLTVFRSLLKQTKIQIDTAGSGSEGLTLTREKKYDIVFLDHMMPDMDGIETLHRLRADEEGLNLHTPVVCLTANAISGAREKYLAEGFNDYLTKPIDAMKLEAMMMVYLPKEKQIVATGDAAAREEEPAAELPDWLLGIEEIDTASGQTHCGGGEGYLDMLKIYGEDAAANADRIEKFWRARDLSNTTIRVHALKSTSRAIGAESLGALAARLESAGNAGDEAALDAELGGLLARYRALGAALSPLYAPERESQGDLPLISDDGLAEAYESIREFSENLDAESAEYALNYLDGFRIPEGERDRVEKLRAAIRDFDWGRVREILS